MLTRKPPKQHQPPITAFFRPFDYWCDQTIRQNPSAQFQYLAVQFRQSHERAFIGWVYLGTFNNYCFYRNEDFTEYEAYSPLHIDNGKVVGKVVGRVSIDDDYYLYALFVDAEFRRQKIGYHLIRLANETMQPVGHEPRLNILVGQRELHTTQHPDERYLTEEGWALIRYCRQQGILQHYQLIGTTPYSSPQRSQDRFEY